MASQIYQKIQPATFGNGELAGGWSPLTLLHEKDRGLSAPDLLKEISKGLAELKEQLARSQNLTGKSLADTSLRIDSTLSELDTSSSGSLSVNSLHLLNSHAAALKRTRDDDESFQTIAIQTGETLAHFAEQLAVLKVIADDPRLQADGVRRSWTRCLAPEQLKKIRETRGLDPVACELVIIGSGPAGIAAAYHAQRCGIDTVLVEASYFASSMSDSRAFPVHLMRTSSAGSSLARSGIVPKDLEQEIGMGALMDQLPIRKMAAEALAHIATQESRQLPSSLPKASDSHHTAAPVTRGEIYAYFLEVLNRSLQSNSLLATEQTPITEASWIEEEKRFFLGSPAGHELKPRYVLIASGAVGTDAETHRQLPIFTDLASAHPDHYLLVSSERDLQQAIMKVDSEEPPPRQVIVPDAFIGHPTVRETVRALKAGSDVLVVGSGESAAKGALALLELNPSIRVNLVVKGALEPMQGQGPSFGGFKDAAINGIEDPDFGRLTIDILKKYFGTPITPESMHDLLEGVTQGRIRIFELGDYFGSSSVVIEPETTKGSRFSKVRLQDGRSDLKSNLRAQHREWREFGIEKNMHSRALIRGELKIAGPIIVAAGYDRAKTFSYNPVLKQLLNQGQIGLQHNHTCTNGELELDAETHIFSSQNPQIAFSGALVGQTSLDGVFSGAGVRSYLAIQTIAQKLGRRIDSTAPFEPTQPSGVSVIEPDPDKIFVRPNHEYKPEDRFPGNPFLTALAQKDYANTPLTPAEELILHRADELHFRLRLALRANQVSPM